MGKMKVNYTGGSFTVYNSFVDKFIKEANPSYIKVYLYILRHASAGNSISLGKVASETGLIKSDVISALEYWHKQGVLVYNNDSDNICIEIGSESYIKSEKTTNEKVISATVDDKENTANATEEKHFYQSNESVASSYKTNVIIKAIQDDKKLSHFFTLIQQMLGKNLSSNDYRVIYSFIDYLKLPEQVIIILFEYCISMKKTNMRYIETIAISWADKGINTVEKAEEYVNYKNKQASVQSYYKQKFKISGREFTDSEVKYLLTWIDEYKCSEKQIMEAFEKTVMNIGKISFKYMNSILAEVSGATPADNSKFRNYPENYEISQTEKNRIEKMLAEFEGGDA